MKKLNNQVLIIIIKIINDIDRYYLNIMIFLFMFTLF